MFSKEIGKGVEVFLTFRKSKIGPGIEGVFSSGNGVIDVLS